jgi:hypothetical protein
MLMDTHRDAARVVANCRAIKRASRTQLLALTTFTLVVGQSSRDESDSNTNR